MKINWVKKLSSRKFWVALVALVAAIAAVFKFSDETVAQITSVISAAGVLVAYILCEGYVDAKALDGSGNKSAEDGNTPGESDEVKTNAL